MKKPIKTFTKAVEGMSVALVGNATSIFESKQGSRIEACDVVIRMNAGVVKDAVSQGSRTDVLVTSIPLPANQILENFSPSVLVWATSKRGAIPSNYCQQSFDFCLHPKWIWLGLRLQIGSRPSTGAIIANYLSRWCLPSRVFTFGFDHFKTKTFYESREDIGPHSAHGEELFFAKLYDSGKFVKE